MRRGTAALTSKLLVLAFMATAPADARVADQRGSFVARAVPFPVMQPDIYYLEKEDCLNGVSGVHKIIKEFHTSAAGKLSVSLEGFFGDWDLYILGPRGNVLASAEQAQVLDDAEAKESLSATVQPHQRVQMAACNWLGEPQVTVQFEFIAKY